MLRQVSIKGEVSNCKYHTSGHIYFTIKDAGAAMNAIMFAGSRAAGLSFHMKEGDQVIVTGSVEVYEKTGAYQLYAKKIELDGEGNLYLKFEQLKHELEEMGMFAAEYKQPIPRYAGRIGVVTAPTGAAVQDIRNVSSRRNPYVQVILYPTLVQGEGAADSIVKGIQTLDAMNLDVIIVGRGGGSIEDLWAFNEEIVARAIFDCRTPIISAVGHETDWTIADFVSDRRAPTPSAAAELAVSDYRQTLERLDNLRRRMDRNLTGRIDFFTLERPSADELLGRGACTSSSQLRSVVEETREFAAWRAARFEEATPGFEGVHGKLAQSLVRAGVDDEAARLVEHMSERRGVSVRGLSSLVKVARVIADMDGSERLGATHLLEAFGFRYGAGEVI